jgi:hypothetical protein
MASKIFEADPKGKSTGQNTSLRVVRVDAGQTLDKIELTHDLRFEPSWVRVTPLSYYVPPNGGLTPNIGAICQPIILDDEETLKAGGFKLDSAAGGMDVLILTESFWLMIQNDGMGAKDAFFLVECGRTHSRVK